VAELANEVEPIGRHSLVWDASGERRSKASSGVYFARLEFDGGVAVRRVVLAR
jgi:hypothetical protein